MKMKTANQISLKQAIRIIETDAKIRELRRLASKRKRIQSRVITARWRALKNEN